MEGKKEVERDRDDGRRWGRRRKEKKEEEGAGRSAGERGVGEGRPYDLLITNRKCNLTLFRRAAEEGLQTTLYINQESQRKGSKHVKEMSCAWVL